MQENISVVYFFLKNKREHATPFSESIKKHVIYELFAYFADNENKMKTKKTLLLIFCYSSRGSLETFFFRVAKHQQAENI